MTTRKSKSKGKGNSHRNGRTKRGGFLANLFKNSFSWFGNNSKPNEPNEPNETTETTEPAPSKKKFDWSFGLIAKLQPPHIPENKPGPIPGKPPQTPPVTAATPATPATPVTAAEAIPVTAAEAIPVTPATPATLVTPSAAAKGGRRLRVCTKKRNCK